jgi:pimeloyl-ACP methyl ester carboxylesterase
VTEFVAIRRERAAARPDAPRLLLAHGLADSASVWRSFLDRFATGAEVWTADLPWRGEGVAGWSRHTDVGAWLAAALDAVPGRPDVVVAHSFAANVLLDLLDSRPDGYRPRGVVLVAPSYAGTPAEFTWDSIPEGVRRLRETLEEGIRVRAGSRLAPDIRAAMADRLHDAVGPYGWLRFFDLLLRTPLLRTGRLRMPCAVVAGRGDRTSPLPGCAALAAALPGAVLHVVEDAGHFPMIDQPDRFAAVVDRFVAGLPPAPARPEERARARVTGQAHHRVVAAAVRGLEHQHLDRLQAPELPR